MKIKRLVAILCLLITVFVYNKIDTLYMVSTIFYSAVIGMVISNNVHLENAMFRRKIRRFYRIKRDTLTFFFIVTTSLFFILDIAFFQQIAKKMGINLSLLTLCVIILFILYNLSSMQEIFSSVAKIEDNDLSAEEVEITQKEILDFLQSEERLPFSRTKIFTRVNVSNTQENEKKYIQPLVSGGKLKVIQKGNSIYYKYNETKS